ncbi:hypothetical protein Hamer_G020295 [Homarus americanus]|uniref:Uncharacterized protein n=1 Tax=Homarus americanus TaxID=6706 RepID=A0A8J5MML3_HOMAM|nr:hypothetical protein Hamer_G020295 [Homarus americanus]
MTLCNAKVKRPSFNLAVWSDRQGYQARLLLHTFTSRGAEGKKGKNHSYHPLRNKKKPTISTESSASQPESKGKTIFRTSAAGGREGILTSSLNRPTAYRSGVPGIPHD